MITGKPSAPTTKACRRLPRTDATDAMATTVMSMLASRPANRYWLKIGSTSNSKNRLIISHRG